MKKPVKYVYERFIETNLGETYIATPIYDVIFEGSSKYQEILIGITPFGKTLFLDNILQLSEYDQEIYHKAVSLPAYDKSFRDVLILGGGDGGVAREIKSYNPESRIWIIDIDSMVTEVMNKYFPEVPRNIFQESNVKLLNVDAYEFVKTTQLKFDYVVNDLTDIREPDEKGSQVNIFYQADFLKILKNILKSNGRIVYHLELYPYSYEEIMKFLKAAREVFKFIKTYCVYISSFGGLWTFAVLSDRNFILKETLQTLQSKTLVLTDDFCVF